MNLEFRERTDVRRPIGRKTGARPIGARAWIGTTRRLAAGCLWSCLVVAAPLQAQEKREPLFTSGDAAVAGGFLVGAAALAPFDMALAGWIQDSVPQANRYLGTGADLFRILGYPGTLAVTGSLYAAGRIGGRPDMAAVGLHATEAVVIAVAVTYLAKGVAGRARPAADPDHPFDLGFGRGFGDNRYQSFPSGHTTAAFATAAAIGSEVGHLRPDLRIPIGSVLFAAASLVGISRMYHNEHWASDVLVGAAIGTFAGWKVVRYHRTRPGNWVDETFLSRDLPPTPILVLTWSVAP